MRARFTEEQELLRRSVAAFLARECPVAALRRWMDARADGRAALPDGVWKEIAALGWLGLAVPAELGGAGLGLVELALVLEESGRVLLPGPLFTTAVFGALALRRAGSAEQQRALLPRIADGSLRVGLLLPGEDGRFDPAEPALRVRRARGVLEVSGDARFALEAEDADLLFAAARAEDGEVHALLLPARAAGVSIRAVPLVDPTRRFAQVRLEGVPADAAARLGPAGGGAEALGGILDAARAALAAEMSGAARQALELSVRHARVREQFGRPIGSLQAIQHRCADMLVQVESACSAAWYAAWAVEHGAPDAHASACLAKAVASDAFRRVAGGAIQVHGGLGFTWEQDPQLYYKRAKSSELLLGDAAFHYELAARELLDRGASGPGE